MGRHGTFILSNDLHVFYDSMQPYHNFSKGDPVDDLANCSRKLELLAQEQAIREEVPKLSKASDQAKVKGHPSNQTKGHIDNLCIFDSSQ